MSSNAVLTNDDWREEPYMADRDCLALKICAIIQVFSLFKTKNYALFDFQKGNSVRQFWSFKAHLRQCYNEKIRPSPVISKNFCVVLKKYDRAIFIDLTRQKRNICRMVTLSTTNLHSYRGGGQHQSVSFGFGYDHIGDSQLQFYESSNLIL